MDAQTPAEVLDRDLAIGVQLSAQVGPNRTIAMTLGIPLEWGMDRINRQIDRLIAVADRLNNIGLLEQLRLSLDKAEKDVVTYREHRANYIANAEADWFGRKRQGDFKMSESQRQQVANWDTNEKNHLEKIIPALKAQIAELEGKIRGE